MGLEVGKIHDSRVKRFGNFSSRKHFPLPTVFSENKINPYNFPLHMELFDLKIRLPDSICLLLTTV